jgi:Acetyltransferase (GNAT) domain
VIVSITAASNEEWDSMVKASPTTVYFQTREWFEIWSEYAGFKNDPHLITFGSGKRVLLPLTQQNLLGGLFKFTLLTPKGMGGFVTGDRLDKEEKGELFAAVPHLKLDYGAANPYDDLTNEVEGFNLRDYTQVLDLSQGFPAIFSKWSRGHHSRTNKGLRQGISVELARNERDWAAYFELYQDTLARWADTATNRYGWPLFLRMFKSQSSNIRLWLAKHNSKLVSGALCLYHNNHVAYWHSATSRDSYKKLNATHVLQYHIIQDACDRGFLLYDFMPSSGLPGVIEFKSGFAPERLPVRIYMSRVASLSSTIRRGIRGNAVYRLLMRGTGF